MDGYNELHFVGSTKGIYYWNVTFCELFSVNMSTAY